MTLNEKLDFCLEYYFDKGGFYSVCTSKAFVDVRQTVEQASARIKKLEAQVKRLKGGPE
jgi:hypothetical protein